MTIHFGDVPASSTLYIPFATYAGSTGASATCTGLAVTDIEIYKNGSVTQRSSDAGYTLLDTDGIDFDGLTGIHGFSLDLSDNTDAGFFSVGGFYWVVVSAITVDSQTVNFIAATFRLVAAEAITGKPKVDVDGWLGTACATPTVAGVPEVDLTHVAGVTTNVSALATNVDAILTDTAEIGAAGAGLTALATQASVNTIDDFLDTEVAAILAAVDTEVAAIKTKTDYLPSAAAGAAGGLFIAGTNAPVTIVGSGNALTLQSTGTNGNGLFTEGNGTGDGIHSQGGLTGRGIHALGGGTSGSGFRAQAQTQGDGFEMVGAGTGKDLNATTTPLTLAKTTNITGFNDIAAGAQMDLVNAPNATAVTAIQAGLATSSAVSTVGTNVSAIQTILSGITSLAQWLGLIAGKQVGNTTARTELRATGAGSGTFDETTDSTEAIRDRGDAEWVTGSGGGGGSGARTVTITVNDGVTALQNANVRMLQGAENYVVATNASGVAVFALDDATWSVAITKPGYTFTPTTIIVNGTETQTYSMTAVTITPSAPGQVTGYLTVYDEDGVIEADADVHIQQLQPITGSGIAFDGSQRTEQSGVNGVVEFSGLFPGGRYKLWRGTDTQNAQKFTLASNATDPVELSSIVGAP